MRMPNGVNRFLFDNNPKLGIALKKHSKKADDGDYVNIIVHDFNKGSGGYTNNFKITFGNEVVLNGAGSKKIYLNEDDERELYFEMNSGINDEQTEGYKCGYYSLAKITFDDGYTYAAPLSWMYLVYDFTSEETIPIDGGEGS